MPLTKLDPLMLSVPLTGATPVIATGTTTSRTLAARFADTVNVKDFGAMGNGKASDASPAFQAAVDTQKPVFLPPGHYHFNTVVRVPNGGKLHLYAIPGTVTLTGIQDVYLFGRSLTFGASVKEVRLQGIIFDGERVRRNYPYKDRTGDSYGLYSTINVPGIPGDEDTIADILDCVFKDMIHVPIVVTGFASCQIIGNRFIRTFDPGLVGCHKVVYQGNVTEFGSDNGISISRGCRYVSIVNNIFKDCEVAGIWVSGYDVPGSGTAILSGASYGDGAALTLTLGASQLSVTAVGHLVTLTGADSNTVTVKVVAVASGTVATVRALSAVPASLQNVAASSWEWAPHTGVDQFTITGNVVVGSFVASMHAATATRRGVIADNTFVRSGFQGDSEKVTTGTVATGSTAMEVADASIFAVGAWVIVEPETSFQDYFVAQVTAKASNTLTLSVASPRTYAQEAVRLLHIATTEGFGVFITGSVTGGFQYADKLRIADNVFDGWRQFAVYAGNPGNGPVRRLTIENNSFHQDTGLPLASGRSVIRLAEDTGATMIDVVVRGNTADEATGANFVTAYVNGTTRRRLVVADNYGPNITTARYLQVFDRENASADISSLYAWRHTDDFGITRENASKINAWAAEAITAGAVDVRSNAISVTPSAANVDITAFVNQLGAIGLAEFRLRNAHGTNTVTIKHDATKIITKTRADVVIQPGTVATFVFLNSSVVAQDG